MTEHMDFSTSDRDTMMMLGSSKTQLYYEIVHWSTALSMYVRWSSLIPLTRLASRVYSYPLCLMTYLQSPLLSTRLVLFISYLPTQSSIYSSCQARRTWRTIWCAIPWHHAFWAINTMILKNTTVYRKTWSGYVLRRIFQWSFFYNLAWTF